MRSLQIKRDESFKEETGSGSGSWNLLLIQIGRQWEWVVEVEAAHNPYFFALALSQAYIWTQLRPCKSCAGGRMSLCTSRCLSVEHLVCKVVN